MALFAPSVADDEEMVRLWTHLLRSGTSPRAAAALMRMYLDIDVRPVLGAITAPTLLMHRADDRLIPAAQGRALAALMPSARYVELEGADHVAFFGDTDAILDEVQEFVTGTRHERALERMLATVMFTDIVGSTERAAAAGDRDWRRVLERHDELVRDELARYRGREIKQTGDGFLAAFDGPGRAVECAAAITSGCGGSGSRSEPAFTRASASRARATWPEWRCTSRSRRCLRGVGGGARVEHRQGSGRRIGPVLRGARHPRAQGRARRVAPVRARRQRVRPRGVSRAADPS